MSTIKMSLEVRAAEPIHVSRSTLVLAALGFAIWGVAWETLWLVKTGTRLEWVLLTIGAVLLAIAVLTHFDHLRDRFGLPALVFVHLGSIAPIAVFLPFALDMQRTENLRTYANAMWGIAWLAGSMAGFLILARKEARLEHHDRSPKTEIHASFFQLTLASVGMLIYGISFLGIADRNSSLMGWLSFIGPAMIAIAIIAHIEHLSLRIGRLAVILAILGVSIWGGKNITRATTDLMTNPDWSSFLVNGLQGISMLLGAIACLLVISHKSTWEDAASAM